MTVPRFPPTGKMFPNTNTRLILYLNVALVGVGPLWLLIGYFAYKADNFFPLVFLEVVFEYIWRAS